MPQVTHRCFMNYFLAAAAGFIGFGCGTGTPVLIFHPPGTTSVTLNIALEKNDLAKTVDLRINGTRVCSESIDSFNVGEQMKGYYRGHTVAGQLHTITSYVTHEEITSCNITYDGDSIGEIEWRKTKLP